MEKNSKIYIAGHRGLVGSAIVRQLKQKGYENLLFRTHSELNLDRQANVENFFAEEKPEYVFLCAGKVGGILANSNYKAEFIYDNIMIAANIINASYKYGIKKLLNFGSSCIYPKLAPQPLKEDYLLTGALEPTNEPYAIAKISAIKLCRYYNEQYGTNFISVMPTNLYGPNDNFDLETSHVLPALIRKFYLAKLLKKGEYELIRRDIVEHSPGIRKIARLYTKEDLTAFCNRYGIYGDHVKLWGTGKPYREFLYVDDIADAGIFLMEKYDYKHIRELINIGTGKDSTIKDIAEMIQKVILYEGKIKWDNTKPDGTPKKLLDVSKLKGLGWKSKISLEDGLNMAYQWFLAHQDDFRR